MKRLFPVYTLILLTACEDGAQNPTDVTGQVTDFALTSTARDLNCRGTVTGTFDNVVVPAGATCNLQASSVEGNVLARERSRLIVSDTRVAGNIDGVAARTVQVKGGSVGGNIHIDDGRSAGEVGAAVFGGTVLTQGDLRIRGLNTGTIRVADVKLKNGTLKVEENFIGSNLNVVRNEVAKDLEVRRNRGGGQKTVRNNRVLQDIKCEGNAAPFVGGPNLAARAEGQCFRS
jgi:hypothetical protein